MKTVRIAAGAGYAGDRIEPALANIEYGKADYIIFECLAERTIALAQKEKLKNPDRGYNFLLEYRMEKIIPLLKDHPVKVITNMGAANPAAAAVKVAQIAAGYGRPDLKIAVITGDDILDKLSGYYSYPIWENAKPLESIKDKIISANAYIGGREISKALAEGADIVITGRVADPSLVTGPLMYEFGKSYEDYEFLGKTIVAGHLLECAGQVTGGYFADPGLKDVPELWDLPFPILTFDENGGIRLEKISKTAGLLTEATVKEQLLYEIQDPANYYTPDVVADFSQLTVNEEADGIVRVDNAHGKPKTGELKVCVGYKDGYIGEGEISYGAHNCLNRAKLAQEILKKRFEMLGLNLREVKFDLIGVNSLYGEDSQVFEEAKLHEVRLRVAARTYDEETAACIGREVEALYVNGPAGGGGVRSRVTQVVTTASIFIPEKEIQMKHSWEGGNQ